MASVVKRHQETQSTAAPDVRHAPVRVETNAERFQWLEEVSRLTPQLKPGGVAFALRLFVSWNRKDGFCFPSQETIADALGVNRASVGRYQKQLEELGLLFVEKRRLRRSKHPHNVYFFTLPNIAQLRSKALINNNISLPEINPADENHASLVTHGLASGAGKLEEKPSDEAEQEVMRHQCDVTMHHQCSTNHVIEPKGGPPAPPLEISIQVTGEVTREAEQPAFISKGDALDARPDQLRSEVDPDQLAFFDRLGPHQQRHFLGLAADDRENFQLAYEVDDDD
ncbi:helix-turn-helix domain-containing protein [Rhizobium leguminosarum]|uniref:helix-turn-helix domain-containing protein n=1 Tax=Rhizobium leguminosarum TaxID=384 RepID=UPI003F9966D0